MLIIQISFVLCLSFINIHLCMWDVEFKGRENYCLWAAELKNPKNLLMLHQLKGGQEHALTIHQLSDCPVIMSFFPFSSGSDCSCWVTSRRANTGCEAFWCINLHLDFNRRNGSELVWHRRTTMGSVYVHGETKTFFQHHRLPNSAPAWFAVRWGQSFSRKLQVRKWMHKL